MIHVMKILYQSKMIRSFDFLLSFLAICIFAPLLVCIFILVLVDSRAPLFMQTRLGKNQKPFLLVKFRTVRVGALSVATHLLDPSEITKTGYFLRRSKLDELPQLWNVLKGDMSIVGPRPCLPTQSALISERENRGIFSVRPGLTGLAQIQGIDMSAPEFLVEVEEDMIRTLSPRSYFTYIIRTVFYVLNIKKLT